MKLVNSILILFIFSFHVYSQPVLDWEYKNTAAYNYYPTTNILHADQNSYICSQSIDANNTAYIFRIDDDGNLLNQDSIHNFRYSILLNKRMVMDNNGSVYLCGSALNQQQVGKIRLIKYDLLLNKTWDITFMDSNSASYSLHGLLYSDTEDRIYLIGQKYDSASYASVIKIDPSGNVLWESIDTIHNYITIVTSSLDNDGNVILGGYSFASGGADDFTITKINTSGNIEWFVNEDGSEHSDDAVMDLCIDDLNNIYAVGTFEDTVQKKIFKFDTDGNKLWSRNIYPVALPKITVDAAGSTYITGFGPSFDHECIIYKYDSSGNFIRSNFSDIPDYKAYTSDYFVNIQTDDSANVYLLNNADSSDNKKWFVAKFDSSLNLLWSFVYPRSIPNPSTSSSISLFEGGFTIAGAINNFGELRVVQFHETFPTAIIIPHVSPSFSFWPNPVSKKISFELEKPDEGNFIFRLYDIQSRLLMVKDVNLENRNSFVIDIESVPNGLFLFNLQSEKQTYNGKLVKER